MNALQKEAVNTANLEKIGEEIVKAIYNRLDENGLAGMQEARWLAIGLASDVKKIVERRYVSQ